MNWLSWGAIGLMLAGVGANTFNLLPPIICIAMVVPALVVFAVNEWRRA